MASQAQIDANRCNAQLSTGPRSEAGKFVSAKNALKHGLRATNALLADESKYEFEQFAAAFTAELRPQGMQQEMVVERLVHLHWKLKRVPRLEAISMQELMTTPGANILPISVMAQDLRTFRHRKPVSAMSLLQVYEQRLHRMIDASMRELRQLRKEQAEAEAADASDRSGRERTNASAASAAAWRSESDKRTQFACNSPQKPELPQYSTEHDSAWLRQVCEPPNGAKGYRPQRSTRG
jgi:hypothetical protein